MLLAVIAASSLGIGPSQQRLPSLAKTIQAPPPRLQAHAAQHLLELELQCCHVSLEEHAALPMPRLVLKARPATVEESELRRMAGILRETIRRREPFTVLWDVRDIRPPSRAALQYGVTLMTELAEDIDQLTQSTVIIASSPVVRAMCRWVLVVSRPPRPVKICEDDAAALEAARKFGFLKG